MRTVQGHLLVIEDPDVDGGGSIFSGRNNLKTQTWKGAGSLQGTMYIIIWCVTRLEALGDKNGKGRFGSGHGGPLNAMFYLHSVL